jgi:hypothetical protein
MTGQSFPPLENHDRSSAGYRTLGRGAVSDGPAVAARTGTIQCIGAIRTPGVVAGYDFFDGIELQRQGIGDG